MDRGRLNARRVLTAGAGEHGDGGGLLLRVSESGSRKWVLRFSLNGRRREMGLGTVQDGVSLAEARTKAAEARRLIKEGKDPIDLRRAQRAATAARKTFGQCADELVASKASEWRSEKHFYHWRISLERHAAPLRDKPIDEIDTAAVLDVLTPLWRRAPETASRLRGRIEMILDAARVQGLRDGENPARWRGHLALLLPRQPKVAKPHHAAMPYRELPGFIGRLRAKAEISAMALEFCILTAARTGEVIAATWAEIDRDARLWTIPAERMKAGRTHRVPLSGRAVEIIERLSEARTGDYVFPGRRDGQPLGDSALKHLLGRMGETGVTVHGFRSAFRDWAGNETHVPREVAEAALAHVVGNASEQAYRRGDALEKRRALMQAWADFIEPKEAGGADVLAFKKPGA